MGVIERLPEQWKNRGTADAVMAPSAILLAGGGAAAAILLGLPILAAIGIGGVVGLARIVSLLPRGARGTRIDPMSIADPWRTFVREALDAQRRYRKAVSATDPGPLRDRLVEIGERIDAGLAEVWRVARRGDALVDAIANLDAPSAHRELEEAKKAAKVTPGPSADATVAALQSQVDSADRLAAVATNAKEKLRLLDARLDEAVARAVELSIQAEDVGELGGLGGDVEALVGEMESLRVALDEAGGTAAAATR